MKLRSLEPLRRHFGVLPRRSWLVVVLVVGSFGPYLLPAFGLRVDHVIIYSAFLFCLAAMALRGGAPLFGSGPLLFLLVMVTLWTVASSVAWGTINTALGLSYMENYVQPIVVVLLATSFPLYSSEGDARRLLNVVVTLYLILLAINACFIVASVFVDLSGFLRLFVREQVGGGLGVWQKSALGGRFTAVFDQPIVSGMSYSLGVLLWAYATRDRHSLSLTEYLLLGILMIGGVISISKLFLFGGIPLFVGYIALQRRLRIFVNRRFLLMAGVGTAAGLAAFEVWVGLGFLLRFLNIGAGANLLRIFSGERFGSDDTIVARLFSRVWQESPVAGLGFGAEKVLDSGYAEFFVQGGAVALFLFGVLVLGLGLFAFSRYRSRKPEGLLLLLIVALIVGGSVGGPVLTANRFSVVLWTVIALASVLAQLDRPGSAAPANRSSSGASESAWVAR